MKAVIQGNIGFGDWSSHVNAWTSRKTKTVIVRYENLIANPLECTRDTISKLKLNLPEAENIQIPSFEELQRKYPNDYRRGQIGSWKDEMPPNFRRMFWRHHGKTMLQQQYLPTTIQDKFWVRLPHTVQTFT